MLPEHRKGGSLIAQAERRNWLLAMRRYLDLSVALSNKKSNKLVDSALRERIQMATVKRERPVPPASVSAVRETPRESVDEIPWNVSQAAISRSQSADRLQMGGTETNSAPSRHGPYNSLSPVRSCTIPGDFPPRARRSPWPFKMIFFLIHLSGPCPPQSFPYSRTELRSCFRSKRSHTGSGTCRGLNLSSLLYQARNSP
jgi:hypothetical protein